MQQAVNRIVAIIEADPHKERIDRIITRWLKRHLQRVAPRAGLDLDRLSLSTKMPVMILMIELPHRGDAVFLADQAQAVVGLEYLSGADHNMSERQGRQVDVDDGELLMRQAQLILPGLCQELGTQPALQRILGKGLKCQGEVVVALRRFGALGTGAVEPQHRDIVLCSCQISQTMQDG